MGSGCPPRYPTTGLASDEFVGFDVPMGLDWVFEGSESFGSFEVAVAGVEVDVEAGSGPIFCFDFVDDACHELSGVVLEGDLSSFEHGHDEQHD